MRRTLWFSIVSIAILDHIFKVFAVQRLPDDGSRLRFPVDLALHKNYGVAFDLPVPLWIVIPITLLVLLLLIRELRGNVSDTKRTIALGLICVGAIGNLVDRIVYGYTVDYLILFGRSAINLSDLLILAGVFLLLVPKKETKAGAAMHMQD